LLAGGVMVLAGYAGGVWSWFVGAPLIVLGLPLILTAVCRCGLAGDGRFESKGLVVMHRCMTGGVQGPPIKGRHSMSNAVIKERHHERLWINKPARNPSDRPGTPAKVPSYALEQNK
jgi:hypothetical protein